MTDKTFPALQRGFAAVHEISISRKAHTTTDEAVELFRFVLEKHAKAAAATPQPGSEKPWTQREISPGAMKRVLEKQRKEEEYQASLNPKGVPIIFPSYD